MNEDDLAGVSLDPDFGVLPEDWDDDTTGEIELAGIRRRVMAETEGRV